MQKLFSEAQQTQRETAATIKKLIWEPLEQHLEGVELVAVSPDGPLAKFPLAALPGKKENTFLIEDIALSVTPTDLPDPVAHRPQQRGRPSFCPAPWRPRSHQ